LSQDERRFPVVFQAQVKYFEMGTSPGEWLSGQFYVIFTEGSTLRGAFAARM
jgi:hypothetical protein